MITDVTATLYNTPAIFHHINTSYEPRLLLIVATILSALHVLLATMQHARHRGSEWGKSLTDKSSRYDTRGS